VKTQNTIRHNAIVTRQKLNNHNSIVIWFAGLSGSGKPTLAHSVEEELHKLKGWIYVNMLDYQYIDPT